MGHCACTVSTASLDIYHIPMTPEHDSRLPSTSQVPMSGH